jgi:hypothetical protein
MKKRATRSSPRSRGIKKWDLEEEVHGIQHTINIGRPQDKNAKTFSVSPQRIKLSKPTKGIRKPEQRILQAM